MFLKSLTRNNLLTITYYEDGSLKTYKGHIYKINTINQLIFLKDDKEDLFSVHLYNIKAIS
ncbi:MULTISPECIES: YolD-like family protein [Priestia]|uniref:YolD-like family protein n=1 Tax=Priestia TaxID=2800373 RepID=UPI00203EA7FC|nr:MULTISPECIES: YolD-like family protein [Priestia]MCM3255465.1 YolD-like family protein [Priestia aryabhattai]MCM3543565.1 YolD-like family protein [Priestia megaterium]MED5121729.1 YolD-like family protein [Priestia megaterium]